MSPSNPVSCPETVHALGRRPLPIYHGLHYSYRQEPLSHLSPGPHVLVPSFKIETSVYLQFNSVTHSKAEYVFVG